ncbi:hypothetical protein BLSTO_03093 [Blastocystis sp. subtype 1]
MLKNLALMGVGCGENGQIFVTDMDRIEKSNLSRQFLFRNGDIGQSKAATAVKAIRAMNPSVHCTHYEVKVGPETEDIFSDAFMESLMAVCNALDNVEARRYMDSRCVTFDKPLLESGTLGTRGNTQIVVPFLTESYGSTNDPQEEGIPMCTLKNYPYKIEHTIQWSRDVFEGLFTQSVQTLAAYRDDPNYLASLEDKPDVHDESVRQLHALLVEAPCASFDDCIRWGALLFRKNYYEEILQLVHQFPRDYVDENGNKFWSGNKLYPTAIEWNETNSHHVDFVQYAAILHAASLDIPAGPAEEDRQHVIDVVKQMTFPPFAPRDPNATNTAEVIAQLASELPPSSSLQQVKTCPVEFEKDDDSNHHIDFIAACANLRAENYGITTADRNTIKKIAGKIIPAISTTTAFVTGAIAVELYKVEQGLTKLEDYRSCFANLSMPMFCFTEPGACAKTQSGDFAWSEWDHIVLHKVSVGVRREAKEEGTTFADLAAFLEKKYHVNLNSVYCVTTRLYDVFDPNPKFKARENKSIVEVWKEVMQKEVKPGQKYVEIVAFCDNGQESDDMMMDNDVDLPSIFVEV